MPRALAMPACLVPWKCPHASRPGDEYGLALGTLQARELEYGFALGTLQARELEYGLVLEGLQAKELEQLATVVARAPIHSSSQLQLATVVARAIDQGPSQPPLSPRRDIQRKGEVKTPTTTMRYKFLCEL
ncbi:hypothetical protein VNO80_19327 [Phaseolus coccineus]|uniref:Uncharacterized protein n=1 Tax=Phaseolus coccineus TaxID=3886 RepID=A0AAN9MJB2_PHACN